MLILWLERSVLVLTVGNQQKRDVIIVRDDVPVELVDTLLPLCHLLFRLRHRRRHHHLLLLLPQAPHLPKCAFVLDAASRPILALIIARDGVEAEPVATLLLLLLLIRGHPSLSSCAFVLDVAYRPIHALIIARGDVEVDPVATLLLLLPLRWLDFSLPRCAFVSDVANRPLQAFNTVRGDAALESVGTNPPPLLSHSQNKTLFSSFPFSLLFFKSGWMDVWCLLRGWDERRRRSHEG